MTTAEERTKILEMISNGIITADEGANLLKALASPSDKPKSSAKNRSGQPRWLRVHVTDMKKGKAKVRVNLPLKLMNAGLDIAAHFAPDEIANEDMLETIKQALSENMVGRIVDVIDEEDQERIEVFIE